MHDVLDRPLGGRLWANTRSRLGSGASAAGLLHGLGGMRAARGCLKVIYVEDHEVTRVGTVQLLHCLAQRVEVLEAASFAELASLRERGADADLLILDLDLPDVDGVVSIAEVGALLPAVPIVVFTAFESLDLVLQSMQLGVAGFILKKLPAKTLLRALQLILDGESYFPQQYLSRLANPTLLPGHGPGAEPELLPSRPGPRLEAAFAEVLTPRQQEVLSLVAQGLSNKEIARLLDISLGTAKNHVAEVLRLLQVSNRREAICKVLGQRVGPGEDGL